MHESMPVSGQPDLSCARLQVEDSQAFFRCMQSWSWYADQRQAQNLEAASGCVAGQLSKPEASWMWLRSILGVVRLNQAPPLPSFIKP